MHEPAATVYAVDSVTRMVIDVVPDVVKGEYVESIFKQRTHAFNKVCKFVDIGYKEFSGVTENIYNIDNEF